MTLCMWSSAGFEPGGTCLYFDSEQPKNKLFLNVSITNTFTMQLFGKYTWHKQSVSTNKSCHQTWCFNLHKRQKMCLRNNWDYTSDGIWSVGSSPSGEWILLDWQEGNLVASSCCLTGGSTAVSKADMRLVMLIWEAVQLSEDKARTAVATLENNKCIMHCTN